MPYGNFITGPYWNRRRSFGWLKLKLGVLDFAIQHFSSHGISIPIGSSNKFTKKLVKLLGQNCRIDQCHMVDHV
jgi:hypothetical protein